MNLFDFDNTIYDGESVVDFFVFCLKKKKSLIIYLPIIIFTAFLYKFKLLSIDRLLKSASKMTFAFKKSNEDFSLLAKEFWKINEKKLKPYYLAMLTSEDIIITASPSFLINEISYKLKTKKIISSEFNINTGQFEYANFKENKVISLKKRYPNVVIKNFYTDSLNDIPLMRLSKNSYLVKGYKKEKIINSKIYKY